MKQTQASSILEMYTSDLDRAGLRGFLNVGFGEQNRKPPVLIMSFRLAPIPAVRARQGALAF